MSCKVADVISAVAHEFSIDRDDLFLRTRKTRVAHPRQLAMYLCLKLCKVSTTRVGGIFGKDGKPFDHTTVMFARDKTAERLSKDTELRASVARIILSLHPEGNAVEPAALQLVAAINAADKKAQAA